MSDTTPVPSAPSAAQGAATVLNLHRSTDERTDRGTPLCSCGHDLGLDETWGEHVAQVLAEAGLFRDGRTHVEWGVRIVEVKGTSKTLGNVETGTDPHGNPATTTEAMARYMAGTRQKVVTRQRTTCPDIVTQWEEAP